MWTRETHQPRRACLAALTVAIVLNLSLPMFAQQTGNQPQTAAAPATTPPQPTLWDLAVAGGIFMIPIAFISVVVVAFALERMVGLRSKRILPPKLLAELTKRTSEEKGLDPREAYRLCQQYKSPLSNVIRAAILKIGRPHAEVEKTVEDTVAREASLMAANIRPINISVSVAPLLGLLGTVQGMIMAFMETSTTTATGTAKAQALAAGIYTALITTFAGLSVAIPAALLAHYLEGRIERLLRDMEELFLEILPQFERYEGKLRITRRAAAQADSAEHAQPAAAHKKTKTAAGPAVDRTPTDSFSEAAGGEEDVPLAAKDGSSPKSLWATMGDESASAESALAAQSGVIVSAKKPAKK